MKQWSRRDVLKSGMAVTAATPVEASLAGPAPDGSDPSLGGHRGMAPAPLVLRRAER